MKKDLVPLVGLGKWSDGEVQAYKRTEIDNFPTFIDFMPIKPRLSIVQNTGKMQIIFSSEKKVIGLVAVLSSIL